jgi:hypothetical protein
MGGDGGIDCCNACLGGRIGLLVDLLTKGCTRREPC